MSIIITIRLLKYKLFYLINESIDDLLAGGDPLYSYLLITF